MDVWAVNEREKLALAEALSGVPDSAWGAEWRVRDVVGHLVAGATVRRHEWLGGFVRSGFNFNRYMSRDAVIRGDAEPAVLLEMLVSTASSHNVRQARGP